MDALFESPGELRLVSGCFLQADSFTRVCTKAPVVHGGDG